MTLTISVLVFAVADPPGVDPPKAPPERVQRDEPKKEAKKDSLFKRRRSSAKKDEPEDAGLIPEGPTPTKQDDKGKEKSKLSDADKDLVKSLGGELAGDEEDPLQRAAKRMRQVEEQLAKLQVEEETVVTQEKIVADLKEIIEKARRRRQQQQQQQQEQQEQQQKQQQQEQQQQQAQQQKKQQDGNQSQPRVGAARNVKEDLAKGKEGHDLWGHLPGMERILLQQSYKEDKLPEYRTQLEKYYSKIAEISAEKDK